VQGGGDRVQSGADRVQLRAEPVQGRGRAGAAQGRGGALRGRGLVSQGRAAELAGVSRTELVDALAARKLDVFSVDVEELRGEVERE
jgi:hypothetical protein